MKKFNLTKAVLFVFIALFLSGYVGLTLSTDFDALKIRKNPAIVFSNSGDSISNRTAGYLDMKNSIVRAKYFLSENKTTTSSLWEVSGEFAFNSDLKTSSTIQAALTAIDSGIVLVYQGYYSEVITAKNNVTIIGVSPDRVFVTSSNDSTLLYANGKSNFNVKNITFQSTGATSGISKSLINLVNCYTDSTQSPKITFDNIRIIGVNNTELYGIKADSSSFNIFHSYIKISNSANGDNRAPIFLRKGSISYVSENRLVCAVGEPADRIFRFEDTRCKPNVGYNQMYVTSGALMIDGATIKARFYFNICNESFSGFTNLIASANNVADANYFIK